MALTDDLVAYYKLDETSGTTADNAEGTSTYDGTLSGATFVSGGKINYGVDLDGSNDYIEISSLTNANLQSDFTLSAWVNKDSLTGRQVLFSTDNFSTKVRGIASEFQASGWSRVNHFNCQVETSNGTVVYNSNSNTFDETGTYFMLTITYSNGSIQFYKNGSAITTTKSAGTGGGNVVSNTNKFNIGRYNDDTYFFNGKIDEVGIWTRALSSSEITSLYNSGNGLQYPFTTGYSKKINGVTAYSKINGIVKANISKVNGI